MHISFLPKDFEPLLTFKQLQKYYFKYGNNTWCNYMLMINSTNVKTISVIHLIVFERIGGGVASLIKT